MASPVDGEFKKLIIGNVSFLKASDKLKKAYREYLNKRFTSETFSFIEKVYELRKEMNKYQFSQDPIKIKKLLSEILTTHVVINSSQEVNISMSLREDLIKKIGGLQKKDSFNKKDIEVFEDALRETTNLSNQNDNVGFKNSKGYKRYIASTIRGKVANFFGSSTSGKNITIVPASSSLFTSVMPGTLSQGTAPKKSKLTSITPIILISDSNPDLEDAPITPTVTKKSRQSTAPSPGAPTIRIEVKEKPTTSPPKN